MTSWLLANIAPIMFCAAMLFLLSGFPVAFSLAACGLFFGFIGIESGLLPASLFQGLPLRVFGIIQNETLLAVPFFTLMGLILERSGMAEDLLDTIGQVFGPIRGGLALAVIFVGTLLAATTGIVAASVISMGLISLPIMLRYGYSRSVACGTIAAAGTLTQAVPPSLVLIVMADQLGRSVGDVYKGALLPAMILIGGYTLYVLLLTIFKPRIMPALPPEARTFREADGRSGMRSLTVLTLGLTVAALLIIWTYAPLSAHFTSRGNVIALDEKIVVALTAVAVLALLLAACNRAFRLGLLSRMTEMVVFVMIPPLALIFLVLGTIFLGVATPTEGGAMGATGALLMAWARKRLGVKGLKQALEATTRLSVFVMFILIGSTIFSFTFTALDGKEWIEKLFDTLLGQFPGEHRVLYFMLVVTLLVFILGFFLDFFEIAFILVPLLAPVADKMGIDLIWFGIVVAINLQTSFLTPPFGFALFFLRSVAPVGAYVDRVTKRRIDGITTGEIYRGALPFVAIQLLVTALLIACPGLVTGSLDKSSVTDLDSVRIELPAEDGWDDWGNPWEKDENIDYDDWK